MSNTDPIKLYLHTSTSHSGTPRSQVGPGNYGVPQIRTWPTGVGGPFMSLTYEAFDAWVATVNQARAEYARTTTLPGELPSTHLGRAVAGA